MVDELMSMPDGPQTGAVSNSYTYEREQFNNNWRDRSSPRYGAPRSNRDPILEQILDTVHSLRPDYQRLEQKLDRTLEIAHQNKAEIRNLKATVEQQNQKIRNLEQLNNQCMASLNTMEQENRNCSLTFNGDLIKVPENCPPGDLVSVVQEVCTKELECNLPIDSISNCKKLDNGKGKKSILLTFSNMVVRNNILSTAVRKKRRGFYVNEHLTKANDKLLYELRQLRKNNNVSMSVFSRGGIPCVRFEGTNERVRRIFSMDDLANLKRDIAQRPHERVDEAASTVRGLRRSERNKSN